MTDSDSATKLPVASAAGQPGRAAGGDSAPPSAQADDAIVRRTKDGWRVGGAEVSDLTSAMALADLISAELASDEAAQPETPGAATAPAAAAAQAGRAGRGKDAAANETSRLRATIGQLEHALTARIRVEQAIGVLAERHRIQPRQAFEQLRNAARNRGRRVIDIASDVVASATNPLLQLPDELSRPRSGGRRGRPARGVLGSE
jgi:hypothetical protein